MDNLKQNRVYNFETQLEIGKQGEREVVECLTNAFPFLKIESNGGKGSDLLLVSEERALNVEVKSDYRALKTGNVFLELSTVYPDGRSIDGGVSKAINDGCEVIIYNVIGGPILVLDTAYLNKLIFQEKSGLKAVKNEKWTSYGVVIPYREIDDIGLECLAAHYDLYPDSNLYS